MRAGGRQTVQSYFAAKNPRTKGEELAAAARYRELNEGAESSTRADLERVIKNARRNFDAGNFRRDLENARTSGLFTRGSGKDSIILSTYGQSYVDALPDRAVAKQFARPKRGGRKSGRKGARAQKA